MLGFAKILDEIGTLRCFNLDLSKFKLYGKELFEALINCSNLGSIDVRCLTFNNSFKFSEMRGIKNILLPIELNSNRDAKVNVLLFFRNAKSV